MTDKPVLGANDVDAIKLGAVNADAMYLGANKIWPQGGISLVNSAAFDSAQLTRTYTSSATWTFSCWVKRSELGAIMNLLGSDITFNANDTITAEGLITTAVFRDVAEWYHICVSSELWINGVSFGAVTTAAIVNSNIGNGLDGYIADIYFIDGQALPPTDFAEDNGNTGQWQPISYAGTYGTTGFHLIFTNNANLGKDTSGNANDFANTGVVQSFDTPTNNYSAVNAIEYHNNSILVENAGRQAVLASNIGGSHGIGCTMAVSSGKWYWEVHVTDMPAARAIMNVGIEETSYSFGTLNEGVGSGASDGYSYKSFDGDTVHSNVVIPYGSSWTSPTDKIGIAFNATAGTLEFFKNGVSQGTAYSGIVGEFRPAILLYTDGASSPMRMGANFAFEESLWTYSAPSGFLAFTTENFSNPVIALPEQHFKAIAYDDGVGAKEVGFQPSLAWLKSRGSAFIHKLTDSLRGTTKALSSNNTNAETTDATGLTSFDTTGFTVGADTNYSDQTGVGMVAWNWKAGEAFEVVGFTGNVTNRAISHSMGNIPGMMIVQSYGVGRPWHVYHKEVGNTKALFLEQSATASTSVTYWNDTDPTSTEFTVGTAAGVNGSGEAMLAYLFAEIEGFSKFGGYTGNANADGPFIYCGFRPAYVMIRGINVASNWNIFDNERDLSNLTAQLLRANLSNAEIDGESVLSGAIDILSNGFKIRKSDGDVNTNAANFMYAAFAEAPFQSSRAR